MKIIQTISACICMALFTNVLQGTKGWRGLAPLYSTRADVERLLGSSNDPCRCIYKTDNEVVFVEYASARCKGSLPGWSVPANTVLSFTVRSKVGQRFSDLNLDVSKFVKTYDDTFTAYYTDREQGISYAVSNEGLVESITYLPSTKDNHLRCPGYSDAAEKNPGSRPLDSYSNIPLDAEQARLDNFAFQLQQDPNATSHIVVYAGRHVDTGEARKRAERAKNYLVNERSIEAGRIVTVDGGHREEFTVELYLVPRGAAGPTATPTVDPSEVQIIKNGNARNNRRSTRPRCKR